MTAGVLLLVAETELCTHEPEPPAHLYHVHRLLMRAGPHHSSHSSGWLWAGRAERTGGFRATAAGGVDAKRNCVAGTGLCG